MSVRWRFWSRSKPKSYTFDEFMSMFALSSPLTGQDLHGRAIGFNEGIEPLEQNFWRYLGYTGQFADITSAVGAQADTASSVPLRVVSDDGEVIRNPPDHLARFIKMPNPEQGIDEFWNGLVWNRGLQGESPFVGVLPDGDYVQEPRDWDRVEEFWCLRPAALGPVYRMDAGNPFDRRTTTDPARVVSVRSGNEVPALAGWAMGDTERVRFPAAAVIVPKRFNPKDTIRGLAPPKELEELLRWEWEAIQANRAYNRNGAYPGAIITSEHRPDQAMQDQFERYFGARHVGVHNRGRTAFVWGTGLKYNRALDPPKDSLQLEVFDRVQRGIRALYRVPPLILGNVDNANRSNSDAQLEFFWRHSVMPLNRALLSRINTSPMVPDNMRLEFDYSQVEVLQENRAEQAAYVTQLVEKRIITRNEGRELLGREPIEGGDEIEDRMPAPFMQPEQNGNGNGAGEMEDEEEEGVAR